MARDSFLPVEVLVAVVLASASAAFAIETPGNRCIDLKNKAAARAFECVARAENKIIEGGTANVSDCYARLMSAFNRVDLSGLCLATGDESAVQQRVSDAENAVLATLQASQATTPVAERCVAIENRAAADLAHCTAKLFSDHLANKKQPGCCRTPCVPNFHTAFLRGNGCAPSDAMADAVATESIPPGTNLTLADLRSRRIAAFVPGIELNHANLTDAAFDAYVGTASDLSYADLTRTDLFASHLADSNMRNANLTQTSLRFVDLTNVDLNGATMSGVVWASTICPDGTESDTNGSNPESCCAHLNGAVPASCSP